MALILNNVLQPIVCKTIGLFTFFYRIIWDNGIIIKAFYLEITKVRFKEDFAPVMINWYKPGERREISISFLL